MPILFLIYISGVFDKVTETNPFVIFLSFIDDLEFIASDSLIKKKVKALEKIIKTVLEYEVLNVVIYNISKIEAVFF